MTAIIFINNEHKNVGMTHKGLSKVINNGALWQRVYDFLLT